MKIIKAGYRILDPIIENARKDIYRKIELAGRTCYKSEDRMTDESAAKFVANIVKNGHEAMLEHASMTVLFTVDRGVSHELVRHRLASFAQESTRYCNYSQSKFGNEIAVIEPIFFRQISEEYKRILNGAYEDVNDALSNIRMTDAIKRYARWYETCKSSEHGYFQMIELGATPQEARSVLPNSLKTDIIVTANMREWRHILALRAAGVTGKPHPQMSEVMIPLAGELAEYMPELFGDILEPATE